MQQSDADTRLLHLQEIEQQLKNEAVVLFLYHEQHVATHQLVCAGDFADVDRDGGLEECVVKTIMDA